MLERQLGCGTDCGSCIPLLQDMLGESPWFEVEISHRILSQDSTLSNRIEQVDFHLKDTHYPNAKAGQHLILQAWIDNKWVSRSYTIINSGDISDIVSVAMRRNEGGVLTPWLLDASIKPKKLRISGPLGDGFSLAQNQATVCFAGGIGVSLAMSLLNQLPPQHRFHLDYSVHSESDVIPFTSIASTSLANHKISKTLRVTQNEGRISDLEIGEITEKFNKADFYICGPEGFIESIEYELQQAQVDPAKIHVERFFLAQTNIKQPLSWKQKAYRIGAVMMALPLLILLPVMSDQIPSNRHNIGHEKLECMACHVEAPGTMRQQLQAKLSHMLGSRDTDAEFMFKHVDNNACLGCHARPQDNHPAYRFLEPRFEEVRQVLAPHKCLSCHREHTGTRVSLVDSRFCLNCHADLHLKKDPIEISHATLIKDRRWETCLGCHDFHGNHKRKVPLKMVESIDYQKILEYFSGAASPYGEAEYKAIQPEKENETENEVEGE